MNRLLTNAFSCTKYSDDVQMTLPMIRLIHEAYGVPPEILIQDYPLKRTGSR